MVYFEEHNNYLQEVLDCNTLLGATEADRWMGDRITQSYGHGSFRPVTECMQRRDEWYSPS